MERRAWTEVRVGAGRTLFGIAAPFNRPADISGMFRETIMPGAFAKTLGADRDVLALADHRSDQLLGRTRSGTLQLRETMAGLEYQLALPRTSLADDLLELAQRNDLGGVSIAFTSDSESWPSKDMRELRSLTLHEVSIVRAHAAYGSDTTIAVRHMHQAKGVSSTYPLRRRLLAVL